MQIVEAVGVIYTLPNWFLPESDLGFLHFQPVTSATDLRLVRKYDFACLLFEDGSIHQLQQTRSKEADDAYDCLADALGWADRLAKATALEPNPVGECCLI